MKRVILALLLAVVAAGGAAGQKNYYNKEFKVGFRYPATVKLSKAKNEPEENFKNLTGISVLRPGKNIFGATASLAASKISRKTCYEMPQANIENKQSLKKFGSNTYYRVSELDGGMESVQQFEFYRIYRNRTCYEVRVQVGMAKNARTNDKSAYSKLYTILRSMYFRR